MTNTYTISETIPHIAYIADGQQKNYSFPFLIFEKNNIIVYLNSTQLSGGFSVQETPGVTGGIVTFETAPAQGTRISIIRDLDIRRVTDFQEGGEIRSKALNHEFNYQMACTQQVAEGLNRTFMVPAYADNSFNKEFPAPAAHKAIVWNSDGSGLTNSQLDISVIDNQLHTALNNVNTTVGNAVTYVDTTVSGLQTNVNAAVQQLNAGINAVQTAQTAVETYRDQVANDKNEAQTCLNNFRESILLPMHVIFSKKNPYAALGTEPLNGQIVSKNKYPEFWTSALNYKNLAAGGNTQYAAYNYTESAWQTENNANKSCKGFVIDTAAGTIRFPHKTGEANEYFFIVCANKVQESAHIAIEEILTEVNGLKTDLNNSVATINNFQSTVNNLKVGAYLNSVTEANARKMFGNRLWLSSEQKPVYGTKLVLTHNLNLADPRKAHADILLKCISAEQGYASGEFACGITTATGTYQLHTLVPNLQKNTITFITGRHNDGQLYAISPSDGSEVRLDLNKWRYIFRIIY